MNIIVASLNPQKINAVKETIPDYPFLKDFEVKGMAVETGVSEQPHSFEETITGAINRAKATFKDCTYSFGIESGKAEIPFTKTGVMHMCVCAIYDGKDIHLGISSLFEPPKIIADLMHEKGLTLEQACFESGITKNPAIGEAEGMVGILTHGRLNRLAYTKQAIMMALVHLENAELFNG